MAGADGEVVGPANGGDIGDVAGGDVAVEAAIEGVGNGIIGDGAGEDGGVEDGRGVVDEFGARVTEEHGESVGEALLDFGLYGVVVGVADVVAEEGNVGEFRERFEELGVGGGFLADR